MSINWQWSDKMGTVTDQNGWTSNIYRGNCFMIAVNEFKNKEGVDVYTLNWFFADKKHMENCLGLSKEYKENSPIDYHWAEFKLNTKYKEVQEFLKALAKAHADVKIELYYEEAK